MGEDNTNTVVITDPFILQDIWFTGLAKHNVNEWIEQGKTIDEVISILELQGSKRAAFLVDFFKGLPGEYEQRFKDSSNSLHKLHELRSDISCCYKDLFKASNDLYDDGSHKRVLCFIPKWELELADGRTYICNIENNELVLLFVDKTAQALKIIIDDIDASIEYLTQHTQPIISNLTRKEVTAETFGTFCSLLHKSGTLVKREKSKKKFCERVANEFGFNIPLRTRGFFEDDIKIKTTSKKYKDVYDKIYPYIDRTIANKIHLHFTNETLIFH